MNIEKKREKFIRKFINESIELKNSNLFLYKNINLHLIKLVEQNLIPTIAYILDKNKMHYKELFNLCYDDIWKYLNSDFNLKKIVTLKLNLYVKNSLKNILEINRLVHFLSEILSKNLSIKSISAELGDIHSNGKSTSLVKLSNGSSYIFKPNQDGRQNLNYILDSIFSYFNEKIEDNLPLKIQPSFSIGDTVISRFINENSKVLNESDINSFYYCMGKILGISCLCHFTDLHCENLITSEGYPFIIDYETLFSVIEDETPKNDFLEETLLIQDGNNRGLFSMISGIQGGGEKMKSFLVPYVINDGTDDFSVRYRKLSNKRMKNRIYYKGKIVRPEYYSFSIIEGYRNVMNLFLKDKYNISRLILNSIDKYIIRPRVVLRPTRLYGFILARAMQPIELIDTDKYWNVIESYMKEYKIPVKNCSESIIKYEISELKKGNIPIFYRDVNSKDLYLGDEFLEKDVFSFSIKDVITEKLGTIDNKYIEDSCSHISYLLKTTENISYDKEIEGWIK